MSATRIKYDSELMKLMQYFESVTGSKLKDCFIEGEGILTFVVSRNFGLAIGKNGATFKKVQDTLKRRIRIVEFSENAEEFVKNFLRPLEVKEVNLSEDKSVTINALPKSRGYVIGKAGSNLKSLQKVLRRYFDVNEVKVV